MKIKSLAGLKQVRGEIESQALAHQHIAQAQQQTAAQAEKNLFRAAVGTVQPMKQAHRVGLVARTDSLKGANPAPTVRPKRQAKATPPASTLSDAFELSPVDPKDTSTSYAKAGSNSDVLRQLRKHHWQIQRSLDLHGLRSELARDTLALFIQQSRQQGIRCVRVIHGKGLSSPGQTPVLKHKVQNWLVQQPEVLAFIGARDADGGAGALVVLLQPGP